MKLNKFFLLFSTKTTKILQCNFFGIFVTCLFLSSTITMAQVESVQDGDWSDPNTWSDGQARSCKESGNDSIVVKHDVTLQDGVCTELEIGGFSSLSVVDNSTLWIKADAGLTGDGDVYVEEGSTLKISGDFTSTGNGTADNDGTVLISGSGCGDFDTEDDATGSCGENETLPVTLSKFEGIAQNSKVSLTWSTVSEINFSHFIVQRSTDGKNYENIGEVNGAGNSTKTQYYNFTDNAPENGMNYYRLKAVDIDDTFEYHKVIGVHVEVPDAIRIMPNPVNGSHFQMTSKIPDATMTIVDKNGQEIESFNIQEGRNQINPRQRLHTGLYIVLVKQNNQVVNRSKLIVQ